MLAGQGRSERLREGLLIAIAGPPNVGKSTLMNQLARRDVAIVSPHAGTTRDIIEVALDLDGYPVTVIDTAGVRETKDPVELEGVRRARVRAAEADLVLWLSDAEHDKTIVAEGPAPIWLVRNKIDLDQVGSGAATQSRGGQEGLGEPTFAISASRGDGIAELISGAGRIRPGVFRRDRKRAHQPNPATRIAAADGRFVAALRSRHRTRAKNLPPKICGPPPIHWDVCWAGSMSRISWTWSSGEFCIGK